MEIDINYALVYYTTNVNVMGLQWKTFGTAFWYDARLENYHQAQVRANNIVWDEIYDQFPHLRNIEFKYTDNCEITPDIPIIPKSFNVSHEPPNHSNKELIDWAEQIERQPVDLKKEIQSSTSLKVLESYKFIVKGKPELEKVYTDKLHEITVTHDRPKEFINQ